MAWQTITVSPPREGCCAGRNWTTGCQNTLAHAVSAASSRTVLQLLPGTYCNYEYVGLPEVAEYLHQPVATITDQSYLTITAANVSDVPRIVFDGRGGFKIDSSDHVTFSHLDISGPALSITGREATIERQRVTGRDADGNAAGCGKYPQTTCDSQAHCEWSSAQAYCSGSTYAYYNGQGFDVASSTNLSFSHLSIHHCPSAAIHVQESTDILFDSNLVFGNTWWTTSATSAIAFAECEGDSGACRASRRRRRRSSSSSSYYTVTNNVVYANRNFIPFYMASAVNDSGSGTPNYGTWGQNYIIDGHGIYTTRSPAYSGAFAIENNTIFDCGINGLSIQKTTNAAVVVSRNRIFDNGRTFTTWEGRQNAGGAVVNSGSKTVTSDVTMVSNLVSANALPDRTYQCYGACALTAASAGNTACGGAPASAFRDNAFAQTNCTQQSADLQALRALYPSSQMPHCPQYTPFREAKGYDCVEPGSSRVRAVVEEVETTST